MEDMDMVLATPDMLDTHMPMVPMDTMERDLLMLSQRLMLIPLSSMELTDMLDTHMLDLDTAMDMLDTHMSMERDLLMLSQRLMLLSSMELTDMVDMDTVLDTEPMDTHTMDTMERDPLMPSQRLMLVCIMVDTTDMPDLMPTVLDTEDTTTDKSQTPFKNSTKQKLKANNILL